MTWSILRAASPAYHTNGPKSLTVILVWGLIGQEVFLAWVAECLSAGRRRSTATSQAATACGQAWGWQAMSGRTRSWAGPCVRRAGIPHRLVSGRARRPGTLILHARVKARPKGDGTHLRARGGRAPG